MRTKTKLLTGGVCIPVLFAVLAVTTLGGAAEFVNPTDLNGTEQYEGTRVNLEGVVTNLSEGNDRLRFNVADQNTSVGVVYDGQMPETMAEGRTVVAKGQYNGSMVTASDLSVRAHEGERPSSSKHHNGTATNGTATPYDGTTQPSTSGTTPQDLTPSDSDRE
jgi:cytochrome c-type biogenesis protein CcmE